MFLVPDSVSIRTSSCQQRKNETFSKPSIFKIGGFAKIKKYNTVPAVKNKAIQLALHEEKLKSFGMVTSEIHLKRRQAAY